MSEHCRYSSIDHAYHRVPQRIAWGFDTPDQLGESKSYFSVNTPTILHSLATSTLATLQEPVTNAWIAMKVCIACVSRGYSKAPVYNGIHYRGVSNSWSTRTVSVTYSEVLPKYRGTRNLYVRGVPQTFRVCPCSVGSDVPRPPPVPPEVYRT